MGIKKASLNQTQVSTTVMQSRAKIRWGLKRELKDQHTQTPLRLIAWFKGIFDSVFFVFFFILLKAVEGRVCLAGKKNRQWKTALISFLFKIVNPNYFFFRYQNSVLSLYGFLKGVDEENLELKRTREKNQVVFVPMHFFQAVQEDLYSK